MNRISVTLLRQLLLLGIIFLLGFTLFWNLKAFLPAILGAYTMYIMLRRPLFFLTGRWRWPAPLAAIVLMLLSGAILFLPIQFVIQVLQSRIIATVQHSPEIWLNIENMAHRLEEKYNIPLLTADNLKAVTEWLVGQARGLVSATMDSLLGLAMMAFILYFMLAQGQQMEALFYQWLPLRQENTGYVKKQLNNLVYSNAIGIPLLGILQGLAGLLAYWMIGIEDMWLWFVITCIAGMIPIAGVALAYIPLSLLTLASGKPLESLILFLYGSIVIGSADNLGRMWLQQRIGNTHPLITLFGVIVGLKLFGFIGFIFGPILISLFLLFLRIYAKEFEKV